MTRITCREMLDFLDDYLAGTQERAVRDRFDQHLDRCPPCRDYLSSYETTVRLARSLCEESGRPAPEELPEELVQAILDALKQAE